MRMRWLLVCAAVSYIAVLYPNSVVAEESRQDDAAGRAHMAETFAFQELADKPCANDLDSAFDMLRQNGVQAPSSAAEFRKWNIEFGAFYMQTQPPIIDAEISAAETKVKNYRVQMGDAKWCALYVDLISEAHTLFEAIMQRRNGD